jgi:hypothetical protein
MLVKLRIIFTILSAICAAAVVPVGTFFGLIGALICIVAAIMFFCIMLGFKSKQEQLENPPEQKPDFFHPKKVDTSPAEIPNPNVREWKDDEENA